LFPVNSLNLAAEFIGVEVEDPGWGYGSYGYKRWAWAGTTKQRDNTPETVVASTFTWRSIKALG